MLFCCCCCCQCHVLPRKYVDVWDDSGYLIHSCAELWTWRIAAASAEGAVKVLVHSASYPPGGGKLLLSGIFLLICCESFRESVETMEREKERANDGLLFGGGGMEIHKIRKRQSAKWKFWELCPPFAGTKILSASGLKHKCIWWKSYIKKPFSWPYFYILG